MMANDGQHQAKRSERGADALSNHWMFAHYLPFLFREPRRLQQNGVGNGNLANIMDGACSPQSIDIFRGEMKLLRQAGRICGKPLAVSLGVSPLGLNAEGESKKKRFA